MREVGIKDVKDFKKMGILFLNIMQAFRKKCRVPT